MAVLKVVLNKYGLAVVGDNASGCTGFPAVDWDSPAWRAAMRAQMMDAIYEVREPATREITGLRSFWTTLG